MYYTGEDKKLKNIYLPKTSEVEVKEEPAESIGTIHLDYKDHEVLNVQDSGDVRNYWKYFAA